MTTSFISRLGFAPEEGIKSPCVVSSITDLTLSGEQTVGGVAVVAGDRVLVRSQTDTTENGIYVVAASAWSRATDFNDAQDVVDGMTVVDANSDTLFVINISGTYEAGTTAVTIASTVFLPSQTGNVGYILSTDGTDTSWVNSLAALDVTALTANGVIVDHTAVALGEHSVEINCDTAGFSGVEALKINYITGALAANEEAAILNISVDEELAVGGHIYALNVDATEGSSHVHALRAGAEVYPIHQESGSFANPTTGTNNTQSTDVADMIDGYDGTTTSIFVANSDYIIIGAAAAFDQIAFSITTDASGAGIKPTFWFSITGTHQFTQFFPIDGTDGFRTTGVISWESLGGTHVADAVTGTYDIKIIRTQGTLATNPVLGHAKTVTTTEYEWDNNGDLTINTVKSLAAVSSNVPVFLRDADTNTGVVFPAADEVGLVAGGTQQMRVDTTVAWINQPLKIAEHAAAEADTAGYGQVWIKDDTPNVLMYTDDAGTDFNIASEAYVDTLVTPSSPSGYVGGRQVHLEEDAAGGSSSFDVDSSIAINTWESVGPTGSSATNIWAGLDSIPANAKAVILKVAGTLTGSTTGQNYICQTYGRKTGTSVTNGDRSHLQVMRFYNRSGSLQEQYDTNTVYIPIDSSLRFDIRWNTAGTSVGKAIALHLVGWIE